MHQSLDRIRKTEYLMILFHTVLFWVTACLVEYTSPHSGFYHFSQFLILYFGLTLGIYAFRGFDLWRRSHLFHAIMSIFAGTIAGSLPVIPVLILFYRSNITKLEMLTILAVIFLGLTIFRTAASVIIYKRAPVEKAFVIGNREKWEPVVSEIAAKLGGKMEIQAYINPTLSQTSDLAPPLPCSILISDPEIYSTPDVNEWAGRIESRGCSLEYMPQIAEDTLGRIPLNVAHAFKNYYNMVFEMTYPHPGQRILDLLVAVPALLLGAVMCLFIIPAIILDSGFPVLFRQPRIGLGGKTFTMHKFRTMKNHKKGEAAFADGDADLITPFGAILRKLRLDEIPQLWDVLRGKMSIVGPRPEQPEFAAEYAEKIPFYAYRHRLRPGITGWAQINYRYAASIEDTKKKLEYDLYYLKNRDALLDIQIILKTAETMLGMRGAK